jgi:hypothetical protein
VIKESLSKELQALWQRLAGRPTAALHLECEALEQAGFFWQHCLFMRGVPRAFSRGVLPSQSAQQAPSPVSIDGDTTCA